MSDLAGKVAVFTGAHSGIGLATAKRFLADGAARVYLTGRRQAELDEAVAGLNAKDAETGTMFASSCSIKDGADVQTSTRNA